MQSDFEHYLFELVVALLQQEFYLQGYILQYLSLSLLTLPEQYEGLSLRQQALSYYVGVKSLQESYELQLQQILLAVLLVLFELGFIVDKSTTVFGTNLIIALITNKSTHGCH